MSRAIGIMAVDPAARTIMALVHATDQLLGNFLEDSSTALQAAISRLEPLPPVVENALREFGWQQGSGFTNAVDLRALSSRLRAMLYSGLEQKGQGSFSTVYRVCTGGLTSFPP